jgi:PAS domain S-box-containing protein
MEETKMPTAFKAPLWTRLILLLPLLFVVWSIWLIVSVNRLQQDVTSKVILISKLNELKLSLREMEQGITGGRQGLETATPDARWQALMDNYHRRAAAINPSEAAQIPTFLAEIDAAVLKMDEIFRRALSSPVVEAEKRGAETEFRAALNHSVDEADGAIASAREHLSRLSSALASKWRQLNVLVVISCLLAIGVAYLLGRFNRDLVRLKQAQDELKKERDFSSAVIETASSLVVVLDREGRIVGFNRACEQATGYSFAELKGKVFWDLLITPDESDEVKAVFAKLSAGEFPNRHENHWLTKDGRLRLISWANTALLNERNEPEYIIGTGQDITESRSAEAARRESHNVLHAVIEGTPDAIFVKDLEGRYILVNSAAARFLGKSAEEITGKSDTELYLPETARQFIEDDRKVLSTGETQTFEGVARGPEITQRYLVTKSVYRDHQGKAIGLIGISHDITERKRAEEQRIAFVREQQARMDAEEANRVKDEFLTTLSHELRTPLTSILGWTQLLNTGQLDDNLKTRALEVIERNARAQRQLIDDLLDISRIVTGKIRLDTRPTSLAPVIETALDSIRPFAAVKKIHLQTTLQAGVVRVQGDPNRLQQVIWNLLNNALKFTPEGGRIEVRLERLDETARITVRDTGEGISPEFLPYVFDRFRQADSSTTREYSGLGVGLALVQYLVKLHGGTIEVESLGAGHGSTFNINLPLLAEREPASTTQQPPPPLKTTTSNCLEEIDGLRVLVVDDDVDSCEIIGLALKRCGVETRLASSAAEALEVLERWLPDLLVSDIGMPDEDGYTLLQKVRALAPEREGQLPAIALTAYATEADRARVLAAGFQLHLVKPVELRELAEAVASLAGRTRKV